MKIVTFTHLPIRRYALILATGDDPLDGLLAFANEHQQGFCTFAGVGAFSRATIAHFDTLTNQYRDLPFDEQLEVVSMIGNIAVFEGKPRIHTHVALGRSDGSAVAGHLRSAIVRPTLELVVTDMGMPLERLQDTATGLALLDP